MSHKGDDCLSSFLPKSFMSGSRKEKSGGDRHASTRRSTTVRYTKRKKRDGREEEKEKEEGKGKKIDTLEASTELKQNELTPADMGRVASALLNPEEARKSGIINEQGYVIIPDNKVYEKRSRAAEYEEEEVVENVEFSATGYNVDMLFPISHNVELQAHERGVVSLALDKSGSRLLSGSMDTYVHMWDFAGMDDRFNSFRQIEPYPGHQIHRLQYNMSGDRFLVSVNDTQFKIFDRDGFELAESIRGDMYLLDMSNTKGHKSAITYAMWHPNEKETILTSGADSTLRIWDATDLNKQITVIKVRNRRGLTRAHVTTCSYNVDGSFFAAASTDGEIHLWSSKGPYVRPKKTCRNAHETGSEISSIAFAKDGNMIATRSNDNTLKLWDIRSFRTPVQTKTELPSFFYTKCIFSPDDKFIVTGTSVKRGEGTGLLQFYDKSTMELVRQIGVSSGSVVDILWHEHLNQLLVSSTDGTVYVYYDPERSTKGALLSMAKIRKKNKPIEYIPPRPIHTPHSLPLFQPDIKSKRQREKARIDPKKSHRPDLPIDEKGPGTGGSSLTQHLMKNLIKKTSRQVDPRAALLKYAKEAEENPYWFRTYQDTQPENVFDYEGLKKEQEEEEKRAKKRRS